MPALLVLQDGSYQRASVLMSSASALPASRQPGPDLRSVGVGPGAPFCCAAR